MTRNTSIKNLKSEKTLGPFLLELKARGIRTKINGRGKSTFMEQFLLDFGRIGTRYLVSSGKNEPGYYNSIPKRIEEGVLSGLKRDGINPISFMNGKPEKHKLWSDMVHVVDKKYMNRLIRIAEKNPDKGFHARQCTVAPANPQKGTKAVLNSSGISQDAKCSACKSCDSKEQIKEVLYRDITNKGGFNELMLALNDSRPRSMNVVQVNLNPKWHFVSTKMLSHKITASFLSAYAEIEPLFVSVGKTSFNWVVENYQRDWISGRFLFPVYFKERVVISEDLIALVNKQLDSCEVVSVSSSMIPDKRFVKLNDLIIYKITSKEMNKALFQTLWTSFDGKVPVAQKGMARELETVEKKFSILPPVIVDTKTGSALYVALSIQANPYLLLHKLLGITYKESLKKFNVRSLSTVRESGLVCASCNHQVYEDISGKVDFKQCPVCMMKLLARAELKR